MTTHTNGKPHIKVVQYMHGNLEYFSWSEKINRHYCQRHGYEYVISREEPKKDRHLNWHKIPVILNELQDCQFLLYLDADAIFYSQEMKIEEELIPLMEGKPILMAQDVACENTRWNPGNPNSGVMLMKNTAKVHEFLEFWNNASSIDKSTCWKWPPTQRALWSIVMPKHGDVVNVHREYYMIQGRFGQYIRHYMLMSDEYRTQKMKLFCQLRNIQ